MKVRHWGQFSYINLPIIFPGGAYATVRVSAAAGGFRVDDGGFAYREIESIGAERSFTKTAAKIAERDDLEIGKRLIFTSATEEDLQRAICDVALASHAVAEQIYRKAAEHEEGEIEDYLHQRLAEIFGASSIQPDQSVTGSSTTNWEVSAIIQIEDHRAVFQAVGNHANSIYRANTAFHDLAELPSPPRLVAVVKDKKTLGPKLMLLGQVARVIESGQTDEVYMRAAA